MTADSHIARDSTAPFPGVVQLLQFSLPLAVGWSLAIVMHRATGESFSEAGIILLLAGIGAAYSFDRLFDSGRPQWLRWALLAETAACAAVVLFAASKMPRGVLEGIIVAGITSLLYTRLKKFPFLKTIVVALTWTWACAALPFAGAAHAQWWCYGVTFPLILILSADCILCDLKDVAQDRADRVPTLPVLIGNRSTCLIATSMAVVAAGIAFVAGRRGIAACGILLAVAAQFPQVLSRKTIGPVLIDAILVIPGALIAAGLA
ncbi:hypothetical protein BH09SUM1_BH09SUM1_24040 [soil metagenome]